MKLTEPVLTGALQLPCSGAVISTIYRRTRRCEIARLVALLKPVAIDNSHAPRAGKADEASSSEVGEGTAYSLHRKGEIIRDVVTRREQHNPVGGLLGRALCHLEQERSDLFTRSYAPHDQKQILHPRNGVRRHFPYLSPDLRVLLRQCFSALARIARNYGVIDHSLQGAIVVQVR